MSVLITSDIHLTDSPRDQYRWGLLPWLRQRAAEYKVDHVLILGDLTNSKDRHSSMLVNKLVDAVARLSSVAEVLILKGNHDFVDAAHPFFRFLSQIDGPVYFIRSPYEGELTFGRARDCLFLPSTRSYDSEWSKFDFSRYDLVFCHATFMGAEAENGQRLEGIPRSVVKRARKVYCGDVHVPQRLGNIEYIGAPYHVRFGDTFNPRVVLLNDDLTKVDLVYPAPRKHLISIREYADLEKALEQIRPNDQVKVRAQLRRAELSSWADLRKSIREFAELHEWDFYGAELDPIETRPRATKPAPTSRAMVDIVRSYAKAHKVGSSMLETGLSLIREVEDGA